MKHVIAQINTDLIYSRKPEDYIYKYHELYWKQDGYKRPSFAWELPLWATNVNAHLKSIGINPELLIIDNINYKLNPCNIYMSVLDCNKDIILQLAKNNPNSIFHLGGYVEFGAIDWPSNVRIYNSMQDLTKTKSLVYDYSIFKGMSCIPRLRLSTGCKHRCKFCTIENEVKTESTDTIFQQVNSICDNLDFELIYIDDKTFGQASNYDVLEYVGNHVKLKNPKFRGFIVQTTAMIASKLNFSNLHIHTVEVGVESYNDEILKKYRKPATEELINKALWNVVSQNINFVPNIILGMPEETVNTYKKTIKWLTNNSALFSNINIYNLAVYKDANLGIDSLDSDELNNEKDWLSKEQNQLLLDSSEKIYAIANFCMDKYNFPRRSAMLT